MNLKRTFILVSFACAFGTLLLFTSVLGGVISVRSSANDIEISPAYTRETTPGQVVTYDHLLTNNLTDTHTFYLEVQSSQGWPVELLGGVSPSDTLQVDGQTVAPFQIQLTVPVTAGGLVDVTIITATSQISPTIWATIEDTTTVQSQIFLPIIYNDWPPIPFRPIIDAISGAGDGNFTVSWTEPPSRRSDTYTLQEAKNSSFTSGVRTACATGLQYCQVTGRVAGAYYYRVRGTNQWGTGEWSNVQSVEVLLPSTPTLNWIDNSDGDGSYIVDWNNASLATGYILQEDENSTFSSPATVYTGSSSQWAASGKKADTHYYRVKSTGPTGNSGWSNVQSVEVLLPSTPTLNSIDNSDGDGNYTVNWNSAARATSYILEEATNANFNNLKTVYNGPNRTWSKTNQSAGTYYYRVKANGPTGTSAPSNTRTATVIPPPSTSGDVRITNIFADGSGSQEPDEYVQIKNFDSNTIQLKNWTLRDNANHVYTFPTFLMAPGQVCRIYTNQWQSSWCSFNYQSGAAIWNNGGDCAILRNANGTQINSYCY